MCAGQGRDVLDVLADHGRTNDVQARLIEWDARNVALARRDAAAFPSVEVLHADAGHTDAYLGAVPADIVLACGVFGNITDGDVKKTISMLPTLCSFDATVIWTRHRGSPDLTPAIRRWFHDAGFLEEAFECPADTTVSVGVHRLAGSPQPIVSGRALFTFVGSKRLREDPPA